MGAPSDLWPSLKHGSNRSESCLAYGAVVMPPVCHSMPHSTPDHPLTPAPLRPVLPPLRAPPLALLRLDEPNRNASRSFELYNRGGPKASN